MSLIGRKPENHWQRENQLPFNWIFPFENVGIRSEILVYQYLYVGGSESKPFVLYR
jgi:hypothetical protein